MLMVKPAGPYLDVIARLAEATILPIAAYQVSGEHAHARVRPQQRARSTARARCSRR